VTQSNERKNPDRRLNPYRPDLAAAHLRGEVEAARFEEGEDHSVITGAAALRRKPAPDGAMDTQILFGETFRVYEEKNGWAWGQSAFDDYVGYVDATHLLPKRAEPEHRVVALRTFIYPRPDMKTQPVVPLPMNAKVKVTGAAGRFSEIEGGGFVFSAHLAPIGAYVDDYVAIAESFLGTPYLWGGRGSMGLDCSGLVQMALERAGIHSLRDTDMQEAALGERLAEPYDLTGLRRGDLVFWRGHVGIMCDEKTMLHANATFMAVTREPLEDAAGRISRTDGPITSVKRLTNGI